ncbi:MAG: hypothetical protein J6P94_02570 [Oscillospiraceae bacterium]|nr:hypothetical protein [Oscillospiraceae bacterium]
MIEKDTIKLLRECDAGIKMGVDSIDDVLKRVHCKDLRHILSESKRAHEKLGIEIEDMLTRYQDEGKEPGFMAKSMSHMKTEIKMGLEDTDATIADLMTDGCNMGIKGLSRYLNQYAAADEKSKDICKKLIKIEEELALDMRDYL